jgi:hypothetical protein
VSSLPEIDLRGNIPSFIHVSDGKMHEVNVLAQDAAAGLRGKRRSGVRRSEPNNPALLGQFDCK